jgi:hypothetical protein
MATGEILRLKCMTMEGLVPVDPCYIAVFSILVRLLDLTSQVPWLVEVALMFHL